MSGIDSLTLEKAIQVGIILDLIYSIIYYSTARIRLRVVSNFGDSGELHERARKMGSREETRHEEGRRKSFFGASTGFEPVASALALQCSPS